MRRYGATPAELDAVLAAATRPRARHRRLRTAPPVGRNRRTTGSPRSRPGSSTSIDDRQPLWLSHLQPQSYAALRAPPPRSPVPAAARHGAVARRQVVPAASRRCCSRCTPSRAGDRAGYRLTEVADRRAPRADRRGIGARRRGAGRRRQPVPLRSARAWRCSSRRTCTRRWSSCPAGRAVPAVGDRVDVQRPLITTLVDDVEWV